MDPPSAKRSIMAYSAVLRLLELIMMVATIHETRLFQHLPIPVSDRAWMGMEDRRNFPFERLRSEPALSV